ncbi:hybrid sensor histidine kinase/response regulator transcription factor [Anditalea andensis]|uniref:histidine kinase n=1 Tax=Anditalea andensis TaxID=1048983 RepID=A0A074KZE7_9BACT|nr:two-component regulator propeller domain-containing protein [Anditalea andensis]KEO72993.1 hypothetical protein EL17_15380 [Anditalea andensis]
MYTHKSILLILLSLIYIEVTAQSSTNGYLFKKLDENKGLSNSIVQTIIKDQNGFMWFGTANGLNRFDGNRIRTFYSDISDTTFLSNSSIAKIYNGPDNNLWVKNVDGIFNVYIADKEIFDRDITTFADMYSLKSEQVNVVIQDESNRYWFGHPYEGISVYDPIKKKTTYLTHNSREQHTLSFNHVSFIAPGINHEIWVSYQNGAVDVLDAKTLKKLRNYKTEDILDVGLSYESEIYVDSEGDAWMYFPENPFGIIHINSISHKLTQIDEDHPDYPLNNNLVKGIVENKKGEIWVGTDHGGLNIIDKYNKDIKHIKHDPDINQSLSANSVFALYKDDEDIIWIGTHKRGINYYHQGILKFSHIRRNAIADSSLPFNDINAFAEDSLGNLFLGTNGGGLIYHNRKDGTYRTYKNNPNDPKSLAGDVIVDLLIDHQGILWIGTYMNGLSRFNGAYFHNYTHDPQDPGSLSDVNVWKLYEDSNKRLWVGTLRKGLNLFDRKHDRFIHYPVLGDVFRLNNQYISSFTEDRDGNLWIGGGYGIDVINLENNYHHYYSANDGKSGLVGNNISELLTDSQGIIWATTSQALNYYDTIQKKFIAYNHKDGLSTDYLISILEDGQSNLWISTQKGLTYAAIDRLSDQFKINFKNFNEKDGLQAAFFNKNAVLKTKNGDFMFGGPNGYNLINPLHLTFDQREAKVLFTEFHLFNKQVPIGSFMDGRQILKNSITNTKHLKLKYDENIFSIDFSTLYLVKDEKINFRYRLEGFNENWIVLSEPPYRVTYTNLDPGAYRLVVQAANSDGKWPEQNYAINITIMAPFWQTPLAYFIYFIILVAVVFIARKLTVNREREKYRRLEESRETRRIKELDRLKTKFFTNISHEFRTPLTLILAPIDRLSKNNNSEEDAHQYRTLQKNARRLLNLVNQLLDIKNIENEGLFFNPIEGDIISFIEESVFAFSELSENKHINLNLESDLSFLHTKFDAEMIEKIIFNLLSNAFKFTPSYGYITVRCQFEEKEEGRGLLKISFTDSGIGIPESELPKIFDRFYTSHSGDEILNVGSGIGLSLALEFARLHGGDIIAKSSLGKGAEFIVSLDLPYHSEQLAWTHIDDQTDDFAIGKGAKGKNPLLLLVEDNEEFRHYLAECLKEKYSVAMAKDGKEGLEKALKLIPDLIISDMMMPHMNGVLLCQHIKKDIKTSHIPVIILTARSSEEKHLEGLHSGCNLYITKPFNLDILLSSIDNLLSERERLQSHYRKIITVNTSEHEIESLDDQLIQKAVQVVENHLDKPEFSVEQMSKEIGISRGQLYKKIHSLTGKSPVEFIRQIRLQRAAQLLGKSQLTIAEVAYKVGYNNAKYFSKHFKEYYGTLPSTYASKKSEGMEL